MHWVRHRRLAFEAMEVRTLLAAWAAQFDFGTAASPVQAGYTQVTANTRYSAAVGYGWLNGPAGDWDFAIGSALDRDMNFFSDASFQVSLPAAGNYRVDLHLGDPGPWQRDSMAVVLNGAWVDTVSAPVGTVVAKSYNIVASSPYVVVRLVDLGGNNIYGSITALSVAVPSTMFDFGTAASPVEPGYVQVTSGTAYAAAQGFGWLNGPSGDWDFGTASALTRDMNYFFDATFRVDLPVTGTYRAELLLGDVGFWVRDSVAVVFNGVWVDTVSPAVGTVATKSYSLLVSGGHLDVRLLDLGGNGIYGSITGLRVTGLPAYFDFGTAASPVEPGYVQVTSGTAYAAAVGYGWLSGPAGTWDFGTASALTRDINYFTDATFRVDLPITGMYRVQVLLGDVGPWVRDQMDVYLNGAWVDNVSPDVGTIVTTDYIVAVSGGHLDLRLVDLGGNNVFGSVTGLRVVPAPSMFDFGTATSPVEPGYLRVASTTGYNATQGYGWLSGPAGDWDFGTASALTRDMNYFTDATFRVDLPVDGTYRMDMLMGDVGPWVRDQMEIDVNGSPIDVVSATVGSTVATSYSVLVIGGHLDVRLLDLGGSRIFGSITSLTITPLGMFLVAQDDTTAQAAVSRPVVAPLFEADLGPIVNEAVARWKRLPLPPQVLDTFAKVPVVITDLPGSQLGVAGPEAIYIDRDAAGHGWYLDPTPGLDEEFAAGGVDGQLRALDPRAVDRIDLLTVVSHELGHVAGLDDLDPWAHRLMSGSLGTGIRRVVGAADLDAFFTR